MPLQFVRDEKLEPETVAAVQECLQNMDWFNAHSAEISEQFKGKYVAVAGGKVFAADSYKAPTIWLLPRRGAEVHLSSYTPGREENDLWRNEILLIAEPDDYRVIRR